MMTAFFQISGVLPSSEAIDLIKAANKKSYGKRGQDIVDMNNRAVDSTVARIERVDYPTQTRGSSGCARRFPRTLRSS